MPTRGPQRLRDQLQTVDAIAHSASGRIERYVIESGGQRTLHGESLLLQDLIAEVSARSISVTLVVADADVLADGKKARATTISALHDAGIVLKDPSGEWHPSVLTVAIASTTSLGAASSAQARRRSQGRAHD